MNRHKMNQIEIMRAFSRTVTRSLGVFDKRYLGRPRPLAASRLIYEIGPDGIDLRSLRERLGVDSGYLSRLLRTLEAEGLVETSRSARDGRVRILRLSNAGNLELEKLDALSDDAMQTLASGLSEQKKESLTRAMEVVHRILEGAAVELLAVDIQDPRSLYALEQYYRELSTRFEQEFDPGPASKTDEFKRPNGLFLVARLFGKTVGCGGVRSYSDYAEIKRMWVDPEYRGRGIASRILNKLEEHAKDIGQHILRLDTNGRLTEARALYRQFGYLPTERYNDNPFAEHFFEKEL